jgi:hypothetical protein
METTLKAMKKVTAIQQKRQEMFFKMRMRTHKATQRSVIKAEIKRGIEILAPAAANKEKALALALQKSSVHKTTAEKMHN